MVFSDEKVMDYPCVSERMARQLFGNWYVPHADMKKMKQSNSMIKCFE